ncbi:ATP-binding protein [Baekduia alba]|uniref:ATP-binding protein n=1 Tax=Baekduia alba TaxID=2997333 RepID=UPI00234030AE|nr:hypothetical protein [Baekduia alba]
MGRTAELAVFEGLFVDDPPVSVVHVHGPGGIGKSALLRQVGRLGVAAGWSPWRIDGRELPPAPGALEAILVAAQAEERPVLLLDTYEQISALDGALRERLLPALPARAIVVLAGRERPAPEWFQDGWEHLTRALALAPLTVAEGLQFVAAHGIDDAATASALVQWSSGSPLALSLASAIAQREGRWPDDHLGSDPQLVDLLVSRLVLARPDSPDRHDDVTAVAAIARVTTASLLAEVLPGIPPNEAQAWLRAQSIAEPVGDGVAMHDLVRKALRAQLRAQRPERERELRRRIADHLHHHAVADDPRLVIDLAELIEDPALRWGFGADAARVLRPDELRPGELEAPPEHMLARASGEWWAATRALAAAAPEHFVVARDHHDALCGLAIAGTPAGASPALLADPYVGRWIKHAAQHVPKGNALIWRDALDLTADEQGDLASRVLAVINTGTILRSGLPNPRCFYIPISPVNTASVAFMEQAGGRRIDGLDVQVGEHVHECYVIDHGPGGVLGGLRATIYTELGLPRPDDRPNQIVSLVAPAIGEDDIRQALRDLDRPTELAASPLTVIAGRGGDAVRALLLRAMTESFGAGPDETLLREVAFAAYANRTAAHEDVAFTLHVSRATYFRRLRQATERICDYVLAAATAQSRAA